MSSRRVGRDGHVQPERERTGALAGRAQTGRYDSTRVARPAADGPATQLEEDASGVPTDPPNPTPGRSLVSRRAVVDVVRAATLGSYGVIGFAGGGLAGRVGERLGLPPHGLEVRIAGRLEIDLDLIVAHGVPIAEVARQVDSAVRYAIARTLDCDVDRLTIHVDGLRVAALDLVPSGRPGRSDGPASPDDLAASGTDVA